MPGPFDCQTRCFFANQGLLYAKRAAELVIANGEKAKLAAELVIANKELVYQKS